MSFEYDFIVMATWIFKYLILAVLPLVSVALLVYFMKRIMESIQRKRFLKGLMSKRS